MKKRKTKSAFLIFFPLLLIALVSAKETGKLTQAEIKKQLAEVQLKLTQIRIVLETYYVDWNNYPLPEDGNYLPRALTTPIAYFISLPIDPFNPEVNHTYHYVLSKDNFLWISYSCGPDGQADEFNQWADLSRELDYQKLLISPQTYDPTNGIRSFGDLWISREKHSFENWVLYKKETTKKKKTKKKDFAKREIPVKTKDRVEYTKQNLRFLATALESYYVDWCSYPPVKYDAEEKPALSQYLTTPIAYVISIPKDIFRNRGKGEYLYWVEDSQRWILTSYGPDKTSGNQKAKNGIPLKIQSACSDKTLGFNLQSSPLTYDPTNGTKSPGDIWRRGPY